MAQDGHLEFHIDPEFSSILLYVHINHQVYMAQDGHLEFHIDPEFSSILLYVHRDRKDY